MRRFIASWVLGLSCLGSAGAQDAQSLQSVTIQVLTQGTQQEGKTTTTGGSVVDYTLRWVDTGVTGTLVAEAQTKGSDLSLTSLRQAWVKASVWDSLSLTFGKKAVQWKEGGYTNPSDLINPVQPLFSAGLPEGRLVSELIGSLPFFADTGLDFAVTLPFDTFDSTGSLRFPVYTQVGTVLYPWEFRLKGVVESGHRPSGGFVTKLSLGDVQWYSDALATGESDLSAFKALRDVEFKESLGFTSTFSVDRQFAQSLSVSAEYSWRSDGVTAEETPSYLLWTRGQGVRGLARYSRDYRQYVVAGMQIDRIGNQNLSLQGRWIQNIDNQSAVVSGVLSYWPQNLFTLATTVAVSLGGPNSETSLLPFDTLLGISLLRQF